MRIGMHKQDLSTVADKYRGEQKEALEHLPRCENSGRDSSVNGLVYGTGISAMCILSLKDTGGSALGSCIAICKNGM